MLFLSEEDQCVADPRNQEHGRLKDPKFPFFHPSHLQQERTVERQFINMPEHLVAGPEGNFSRSTLYFLFIT